jgi:hypothetical protein
MPFSAEMSDTVSVAEEAEWSEQEAKRAKRHAFAFDYVRPRF